MIFSIFKKNSIQSDKDAIDKLITISCFGAGSAQEQSRDNMEKVLSEVEQYSLHSQNCKLFYWLGIAWRNFTAWHERGEQRISPLNRSISNFEKSFQLAKKQIPTSISSEERGPIENLDQITIAGELGSLLADDAPIRDLERAEEYLRFVFESIEEYEPCLCSYAELFYKKGDFEKCAEIALNAIERAKKSSFWCESVPPAPANIAGKAFRALAMKAKKAKDIEKSKRFLVNIIGLGVATENDKKILSRLQ